jgi:SAM-dependent methyltransferase
MRRAMMPAMREGEPYYRDDLARIHHLGYGFHADRCAPGILALLKPIRERDGVVVELGCGSGLLTRYLVDAGHRVVATDASPAMLDIARTYVGDALEIGQLVLPDDPIPPADAVVSVGHVLNYLPSTEAIYRALVAIAHALRPGGLMAIDLCDLSYHEAASAPDVRAVVTDEWAIINERSLPSPDRFVRQMAIFTRNDGGSWRRDDERHENVLIDTSIVPALLAEHGIVAELGTGFDTMDLEPGLHTIVGRKA